MAKPGKRAANFRRGQGEPPPIDLQTHGLRQGSLGVILEFHLMEPIEAPVVCHAE